MYMQAASRFVIDLEQIGLSKFSDMVNYYIIYKNVAGKTKETVQISKIIEAKYLLTQHYNWQ